MLRSLHSRSVIRACSLLALVVAASLVGATSASAAVAEPRSDTVTCTAKITALDDDGTTVIAKGTIRCNVVVPIINIATVLGRYNVSTGKNQAQNDETLRTCNDVKTCTQIVGVPDIKGKQKFIASFDPEYTGVAWPNPQPGHTPSASSTTTCPDMGCRLRSAIY